MMDGLTTEQRKANRQQLLTGFLMERDMLTIQYRVFKRLANVERMKELEASLLTLETAIDEATKIWDEIEHEGALPVGDLQRLYERPNGSGD